VLSDEAVDLSGGACLAAVTAFAGAIAPLVPPRGRVGVFLPPSAAQALAIVQVLAAERVPVVLDPWLSPARLADACRRGGLHALAIPAAPAAPPSGPAMSPPAPFASAVPPAIPPFAPAPQPSAAEEPPGVAGPLLLLDRHGAVAEVRPGAARAAAPPPLPLPLPIPEAALILNTSGSTGEPKAVVLPAAGLAGVVEQLIRHLGLGPSTVAAIALPLHHTMALNTQLLPTLLAGGRAVVFDAGLGLGRTYRDLLDSGATFVSLVSEMLRPCQQERTRRGLPPAIAVTEVQLSGGAVLGEHLAVARALFPAARLHKGYGLTEAVRVTMIDSLHPRFGDDSAGFPLPGQEVMVRDRRGRPLAAGHSGQICVRGAQVMLGYDGEDAQPFRDGFLETGDVGFLTPDGRLVVEGRRDGIFKSYGRRIAAAEIERAGLRCPGVAAAKCIAVPCATRGSRPVLFVQPEPGLDGLLDGAPRAAVEAALRRELEPYKVPREIVVVDEMPRSPVGKIEARELERWWRLGLGAQELGRGPLGCRFRRLGGLGRRDGVEPRAMARPAER
jgi:long-chain acyl-CoA synthetase